MRSCVLAATAALSLGVVTEVDARARATPPPTFTISSVSVNASRATVDVRGRLCVSVGPGAVVITREERRVGSKLVARKTWTDPLGVDVEEIYPRECVNGWRMSWLTGKRFVQAGPGVCRVTIRVRDGYGRTGPAAVVTLQPGPR